MAEGGLAIGRGVAQVVGALWIDGCPYLKRNKVEDVM